MLVGNVLTSIRYYGHKIKFDFFKAYTNAKDEIKHCEYRNINGEKFKLIVHV